MVLTPAPLITRLRTTLAPVLGTYQIPGSPTTEPALICCQNIDKHPPTDWQISGIEGILIATPEHLPVACFGGVADRYQWHFYLVQHDRNKGLEEAIERIFGKFQRAKIAWQRSQTREDLEQCLIYLPGQQYVRIDPS